MESKTEKHKVMTMDSEKRERIINAALTEFCKGYKHASTDVMVKEAGISKGLLYHYFGTKKELLNFLYDYAKDILVSEFIGKTDFDEIDFFERLWGIMRLKMDLTFKYPAIFDFLTEIYLSDEREFKELSSQLQGLREQNWQLGDEALFRGTDFSLFKEGVDVQKVVEIVKWTFAGYSEELLRKYPTTQEYQLQYDRILEGVKEYLIFFRKTFYQN